jgi:hypothetical protein
MARQVANVDIQTDTFGSWIARTNDLLESFSNEVLTANSTSGVTGTPTNNRNSTLYGRFNTNTFYSSASFQVGDGIYANTTSFTFSPNIKIVANNRVGTTGQVLAIGTTGLYWTDAGLGTVTRVQGGDGISGDVTAAGILSVRPSTGITVGASGVSVNATYISTLSVAGASALQTRTWDSPAPIGSTIANTGAFTTLAANSYSIVGDSLFIISNTVFRTQGYIESFTPATGTMGGLNLRGASGSTARFKVTDYLGSTTYGTATVDGTGRWLWSGSSSIAGNLTVTGTTSSTENLTVSSGSNTITLASNGTISAKEIVIPNTSYVKMSDFANNVNVLLSSSAGATGNWTRLPNGMLLQWGIMTVTHSNYDSVTFPTAFLSESVSVVVSGGIRAFSSANENPTTVWGVFSTGFYTYTAENVNQSFSNPTAWWMAMGF